MYIYVACRKNVMNNCHWMGQIAWYGLYFGDMPQ
jgi:hypothetical protein